MEKDEYQESKTGTDLKILVGFIACCLGVTSHYYPLPFPQNKMLLVGCIVGYMICATLYYLIEYKIEKDSFFIAKSSKVSIQVYISLEKYFKGL